MHCHLMSPSTKEVGLWKLGDSLGGRMASPRSPEDLIDLETSLRAYYVVDKFLLKGPSSTSMQEPP